jgi:hypothetical protein
MWRNPLSNLRDLTGPARLHETVLSGQPLRINVVLAAELN